MTYREEYDESRKDPEAYWRRVGERLLWEKPFTKVSNASFEKDVQIRWFEDGVLNASVNCVDRHLPERADAPAIIWVPDDTDEASRTITYGELSESVQRFANILKKLGVSRGDVVTIYLPMIPEAAYAMLACARIGAVHSVVFAGFSAESLAQRLVDAGSRFVITADEGRRGGKRVPLKATVDEALAHVRAEAVVLLVRNTGADVPIAPRDVRLETLWETVSPECPAEPMGAEDPLFILYTSGSTGRPKGLLHTTGGYLAYVSYTHERAFDYREGETYWCTADIGWITGHSYVLYGPLVNGATTLMFEGVLTYPTPSRIWDIVDQHAVAILYTAPTLIRSLMAAGDKYLTDSSRASLRILGTVGEPINPEAWRWYYEEAGGKRCPIIDTWWQTETGGIMITPLPEESPRKPGSALQPFFGILPGLVDDEGGVIEGPGSGRLVITESWPGQARTIWGDHERFVRTYFTAVPGAYITGDGAARDANGDYTITGRIDDVVNISGHRFGTAEIESALIRHPSVAEAAAVGIPHPIKGQSLSCAVVLRAGLENNPKLVEELKLTVRSSIGAIAVPDDIRIVLGLPKTRSGKIMRRIVRSIASGEDELGDVSTLVDPGVISELKQAWSA